MEIKWCIDEYLRELGYWIESVEFLSSIPTKMTKDIADRLLEKDEELSHLDKRVNFYDEYGQTYVENLPQNNSAEMLKQFMKQELPVETFSSFCYLDAISDMIQQLQPTYRVYGYYHFIMDKMTVLDKKAFLEELVHYHKKGYKNFEIGELCHGAPLPSGEIDLISHLGRPLLHIPYLKSFEYEEKYRYFDIVQVDGTKVFEKVTMENLALILFSLIKEMSPLDMKQHFLDFQTEYEKPTNMTELTYYRYYTSERLLLTSKQDICSISELEESNEPGFEGEYRFSDSLDFRESSRVILTQDILNVLMDEFLGNKPKDITETLHDFSKLIIELADDSGLFITKRTRWLRGKWFMFNVELDGHGNISKFTRKRKNMMSYDAQNEHDTEANPTYPVEVVYDLTIKKDNQVILREVDIAKLVTVLIDYYYKKFRRGNK